MDYQRIYNQLIENAKLADRKKVKGGQYFERHHIIPKSIGGLDDKDNLVLLTPREHFVAHKLLVEIYPKNRKLYQAAWLMITKTGNDRTYQVTSREYEFFRQQVSINMSETRKGWVPDQKFLDDLSKRTSGSGNPMYGRRGADNPNTGRKNTEETKAKMSLGQLNMSDEAKKARGAKVSAKTKGKKKPEGTGDKVRKALQGRKLPAEQVARMTAAVTIAKRTPEARAAASARQMGRVKSPLEIENIKKALTGVPHTPERIENIRKALTGRKATPEQIEKNRISHTGEKNGMHGKHQHKVVCPHCGKEGGDGAMRIWHFDNCKHNPAKVAA